MPTHQADSASLAQHLLVATRAVDDGDIFDNSVIYLCEHNDKGATGFVINKYSAIDLDDIYAQMNLSEWDDNPNYVVSRGGPMEPERGFVLHTDEKLWRASYRLNNGIAITLSKDILSDMACGHGPTSALFVLGYASWTAGQLEQEIADNYWLVTPASSHIVLDAPLLDRAKLATQSIGVNDLELLYTNKAHA